MTLLKPGKIKPSVLLSMAQQPLVGHLNVKASQSRLNTCSRTPPMQRPLPNNTQHCQETDIHILSGTQMHNPSKRVTVTHTIGRTSKVYKHKIVKSGNFYAVMWSYRQ